MLTVFATPMIRFILTIIAIVVLAYILIKFRSNKNPKKDSIDMLKNRLDKGEISKQDYEDAKKRQGKK